MPNWCTNAITFYHQNPDRIKELASLVNYNSSDDTYTIDSHSNLLNYLRPLPDGVWDYNWCVDHWGTKWEVDINHVELFSPNCIAFYCDSAWTPPIDALGYAESQKGFNIKIAYIEPGSGILGFCEDGVSSDYEYPRTLDEALALIDTELPDFMVDGLDLHNEFTFQFTYDVH
jgi:hypothetical protein